MLIAICLGCDEHRTAIASQAWESAGSNPDLAPPKRIFAKRFVSPVRDAPRGDAPRLGYMRAGMVVGAVTHSPVGHEGCEVGWYELISGGYVCAGRDVIAFLGERLPEVQPRQPDRRAVLPYEYATVREQTPVYRRIPRPEQVVSLSLEDEISAVQSRLLSRVLQPGFYVSLDRRFDRHGVTYWRTHQNGFVAAKRLRKKKSSPYEGRFLDRQGWTLPMAVTIRDEVPLFRQGAAPDSLEVVSRLDSRTWMPVHSQRRIGDRSFIHVGQGRLVRPTDVSVIQPKAPPATVSDGDRWIDVDLDRQVLVAYDWKQPRYVTLMSSGRKSANPERDFRTPVGTYRIRAKHLTAMMDGDEPGEPPYSLEDVPYVMYFHGAYAFHAAFWHDRFGRPRSHGCINLAPSDAKWLYEWAGPELPDAWHGGFATKTNPGTWVVIHGETR